MENVAPGTMRAVGKELRDLTQHPLDDINIVINDTDLTNITAYIIGPSKKHTFVTMTTLLLP